MTTEIDIHRDDQRPATTAEWHTPPQLTERALTMIEREAAVIARSPIAGKLQGDPASIAVIGIHCHQLQIPITSGITDMPVIEKTPTLSARLRAALARREGHEVWFDESTMEAATACVRRRGERRVHRLRYTLDDARKNHRLDRWVEKWKQDNGKWKVEEKYLLDQPGVTEYPKWVQEKVNAGQVKCFDAWQNNPAAMLRAAAMRNVINMAGQDALLGITSGTISTEVDYELEEFDGDDVTVEDVMTEAVPTSEDAPIVFATDDDKTDLKKRLAKLLPHQKEWLYAQVRVPDTDPPIFRLCNIATPQMQAAQLKEWQALLDAAKQIPHPGPSSERIEQTMADVKAAQQDDDAGRPFE